MIVAFVATPHSRGEVFAADLAQALGFAAVAKDRVRTAFETSESRSLALARVDVSAGIVPSMEAWAQAWWDATPTNVDVVLVCFPPTLAVLTAYEAYAAQPVLVVSRLAAVEFVNATRASYGCPPLDASDLALKRFNERMLLVLEERRQAGLLVEAPVGASPDLIAEQIADRTMC